MLKVYNPERTSIKNNQNNSATTFSAEEDDSSRKVTWKVPTRSKYLKSYRKERKMEVEGNDERHQRAGLGSDMQPAREMRSFKRNAQAPTDNFVTSREDTCFPTNRLQGE